MATFAPDGHRSVFSRAWLAASALDVSVEADPRAEDGKVRLPPAEAEAVYEAYRAWRRWSPDPSSRSTFG